MYIYFLYIEGKVCEEREDHNMYKLCEPNKSSKQNKKAALKRNIGEYCTSYGDKSTPVKLEDVIPVGGPQQHA